MCCSAERLYHIRRGSRAYLLTNLLPGRAPASSYVTDFKKLRVRWHPDRFFAKFGSRMAPEEKEAIMAKVTQISAQVNELAVGT